jgi:GntR family transcriptional regulator
MLDRADALDNRPSALDPSAPVPLYHQLRSALEQSWRGRYGPDDDLPTEQEVIERFQVSRITVRRALDEMIADGVIQRVRARGRLRWAPAKVKQQLSRLRGFFTYHALAAGHHPSTRVLEFAQGTWPDANRLLQLDSAGVCYRIARLHESDGQPLSYQVSYIPRDACPDPSVSDLSGSLLRMIEQHTGRRGDHAEQRLGAREATAQEATLLQLPPRSHVFQVEWVVCDQRGAPMEYFVSALDIARYEFLSTIQAEPDEEAGGGRPSRSPWGP